MSTKIAIVTTNARYSNSTEMPQNKNKNKNKNKMD
jgi:hypothetical protein